MKKYIILFTILVGIFNLGYTQCIPPTNLNANVSGLDVSLHWNAPIGNGLFSINEVKRDAINTANESSPTYSKISNYNILRDYLDLQFSFPVSDDVGQAGVESDGSYIYTSIWSNNYFVKYDFDGNVVDTFSINGVSEVRDMAFCEVDSYMYGASPTNSMVYIMDFSNGTLVDYIYISDARAIAYDVDLDVFYANNWGTDVQVIDRQSGNILDAIPLSGAYGSYYGFAYDNWSVGGPFLWGFSQDGSGSDIVQLNLPNMTETGVVIDVTQVTGIDGIAGGLFTQPDIIEGTITLGGLMQNEIIFGLELVDEAGPTYILAGYNVYRDGVQINSTLITDSSYIDLSLNPGMYEYKVTAVYTDEFGSFLCESDTTAPISITIEDFLLLGGNIFAGTAKLDFGEASTYKYEDLTVQYQTTVDIDEIGYYFFYPLVAGNYYVKIDAVENSTSYNDFIPTYYGNVYHWENSQPVNLQSNIYNADIEMIPLAASNIGAGRISGNVYFEDTDVSSTPANDIQFLLLNANEECIAFNHSNNQGYFSFTQLENGTYKILCEIFGKKMDPMTFVINNSNQYIDNIIFYISNDEIVLGIDDDLPENISSLSNVFPSPAKNVVKFYIETKEPTSLSTIIINYMGQNVLSSTVVTKNEKQLIEFDISNLVSGYYQLLIWDSNSVATRKFIKIQ
ncbi:MAG: T9SS type A sorting domain-containing protein [Bacteroidota bacterium]